MSLARVGIGYMTGPQFEKIDAEYCLAEGGTTRVGGAVKYATVQMMEKRGRGIELVARGIAGHGSVPLASNAIVRLAGRRLTEFELELRTAAVGRPAAGRWR